MSALVINNKVTHLNCCCKAVRYGLIQQILTSVCGNIMAYKWNKTFLKESGGAYDHKSQGISMSIQLEPLLHMLVIPIDLK